MHIITWAVFFCGLVDLTGGKKLWSTLTLKPDLAVAHNNLGNVLKELRRIDEAEKVTGKLSAKPDFAEAYFNLGLSLYQASWRMQ